MKLLAIDPGDNESAMVCYDTESRSVPCWWLSGNYDIRGVLRDPPFGLIIEPPLLIEYTPPSVKQELLDEQLESNPAAEDEPPEHLFAKSAEYE